MITRVRISGYQSIDSLDLALEPFTVIVGPSSSGKSAFIRALRGVATYQRGSSFISSWRPRADGCTVALSLADGARVTLHRAHDSSKNRYTLQRAEADPEHYTKLAGSVPTEVSTALGIGQDSSLQLALQFDPPYLLAASPSEAHATLAALTGVTTILAASREANRRRLATNVVVKTLQHELTTTRELLAAEPFASLDARLELAEDVQHLLERSAALEEKRKRIEDAVIALELAKQRARDARAVLDVELPTVERLVELRARHEKISSIRAHWLTARTEALAATAILERPVPTVEHLVELQARHDRILALRDDLQRTRFNSGRALDSITGIRAELESLERARTAAVAALTVCPTCGRPYDESKEPHAD